MATDQQRGGPDRPNRLEALLRRCVVRIDSADEFLGSGFFVAPGDVLTCAHVVHGRGDLRVTGSKIAHPATVMQTVPKLAAGDPAARFFPLPDVALLRLTDPPVGHACVRFDPIEPVLGRNPDVLRLEAFTKGQYSAEAVAPSGVSLEYEGLLGEQGVELYKLTRGQIVGGYSGGPLLNLRTGGVCAMVDSTRDEHYDLGGYGVPITAFLDRFDDLADRNAAYHRADARWQHAHEADRVEAAIRQRQEAGVAHAVSNYVTGDNAKVFQAMEMTFYEGRDEE